MHMPATLMRLWKDYWVGLLGSAAVVCAVVLGVLGSGLPALFTIIAAWIFSISRVQLTATPEDVQHAGRQLLALTRELDAAIDAVVGQAREEIQQAGDLLRHAVADLDHGFGAIAGESAQQQLLLQSLHEQLSRIPGEQAQCRQALSDLAGKLASSNDLIHENAGLAVRALQFEDLVHQVLQHLSGRMTDIEALSGHLAAQAGGLADVSSAPDCANRLSRLRGTLHEKYQQMKMTDQRAVTQSSMDEGDVELF